MKPKTPIKEKVAKPEPIITSDNLPPLLSAKHVMFIMSCSRPTAEDIMNQPHRPVWQMGFKGIKRLHRDIFLEQLKQECKTVAS